jgi:hypothetical protein
MLRSVQALCLFGAVALFAAGSTRADHAHIDGAAHINNLQANAQHPMGKGYHAHTDANAKISHVTRNGQKHAKVFGATKQLHQNGQRLSTGLDTAVPLVERVSADALQNASPSGESVAQFGNNIAFVGFAFELGNGFYQIVWFPVNVISRTVQVGFVL